MSKVLIVFFTRTDNSRKIAEQISTKLKSDVDEIVDNNKWKGIIGFLKGGLLSTFEKTTKITNIKDPSKYDVVVIISPVWASTMPPAIRAYINNNISKIKNYALIINNGGGNVKKALKNFRKILPSPIDTYGTSSKDIDSELCQKRFEEFSDAIRRTLEKESSNV